jgi:hypothetical protein
MVPGVHVGKYLWRVQANETETDRGDPINILFTWASSTSNADGHFSHHHGGWGVVYGGDFYHLEHCCRAIAAVRRATADCGDCDRDHIRIFDGSWDANNGVYAAAAVHTDVVITCNGNRAHRGDGYDAMRLYVSNNMEAGGHVWIAKDWKNTDPAYHCDGSTTNSNGWVRYIDIR